MFTFSEKLKDYKIAFDAEKEGVRCEGGDILVYEDAAGNISFSVDADLADVVIGDATTAVDGLLTIYGDIATVLRLGDATHEGGDIIVYSDAAGSIQFHVDADDGVGVGGVQVAGTELNVLVPASDTYGFYVDRDTNPVDIHATTYGAYIIHENTDVTTTISHDLRALFVRANQYRTQAGTATLYTTGIFGFGVDYRGWSGVGSGTRYLRGLYFSAYYQGHQASVDIWPTLYQRASHIYSRCYPYVDVAGPGGGLTAYNYGVYARVYTNPRGTNPTQFTGFTYGFWADVTGTTEGTHDAYGLYTNVRGADVNYAWYEVTCPSMRLPPIDAAPADAPAVGTFRIYDDGMGTLRFYVYGGDGAWHQVNFDT